ncbi:serine acetyltransferase [Alginatibacterium sediminis]|uniref:Serine acetyltransferase n=1 Tax=Alginatibacterium sediminis TaxID=2164068 RepID=A0A420E799_9ALTE|nr:serine acetyltransferase [Alginatibacterium sediminis]RKF14396.1 serine acetyltransferase [Alginatibacterium sediminis]
MLKKDFRRKQQIFWEDGAQVSMLRILISDGSGAMILYRLMRWLSERGLAPLALVIQWLNKFLNGCVIGQKADFDEGFVIMHPVGIVINSKVKAGKNVTLESGVVIGDEKGKSPVLHDDIFIGSGAKIIGGLTIANHVKVGANAVVTKSALQGETMLGIPAKAYNKS